MIDFELIRQTTEITVGRHPGVVVTGVVGIIIGMVIAIFMTAFAKYEEFWFALGIAVSCLGALCIIFAPTTETRPSTEAMTASQEAYEQVAEAVADDYDVEVVSMSSCGTEPADIPSEVSGVPKGWNVDFFGEVDENTQEHYNRVRFLEQVVSQDFVSNPQLLLAIPSGIVTCYSVQYDQSTGTTTLLVGGENINAMAPQSLKKD